MEKQIDIVYYIKTDTDSSRYMYIDTLIIVGVVNRYKGEGTKALNKLISIAIENNCDYIELKADTKQRQVEGFILTEWYKKFGFYEVDKQGWMVTMRKKLNV